eukprot:UN33597
MCDPSLKVVQESEERGYVNSMRSQKAFHDSSSESSLSSCSSNNIEPENRMFSQNINIKQLDYLQPPPPAPVQFKQIILNTKPDIDKTRSNPLLLEKPSHIHVNHLYLGERVDKKVISFGMTQRFREKTYTIVYYKHEDSCKDIDENIANTYQDQRLHESGNDSDHKSEEFW